MQSSRITRETICRLLEVIHKYCHNTLTHIIIENISLDDDASHYDRLRTPS